MNKSLEIGTCTTEQPSPAVLRLRRHRQRERQGIACASVEVTGDIMNMLVRAGYLPDNYRCTRNDVNMALSKYLSDQACAAVY